MGGGNFTTPLLFSCNNWETVKAVTLVFCSIQLYCIRYILAKFGLPNSPQPSDIGQNSDGGVSKFRISGQSFISKNRCNSKSSHDIDMKLGPVTKVDKRKMATSKKLTMTSCQQIAVSLSSIQFMANLQSYRSRIPDA